MYPGDENDANAPQVVIHIMAIMMVILMTLITGILKICV
jgi:hypothetical protein